MFDEIVRMLTGAEPVRYDDDPSAMRLAVAALLVTAAQADDTFEDTERRTIERLLAARFGLSGDAVERLLHAAERQADEASGLFRFVRSFVENSRPEERVWLIEMLWEVAYADGHLAPDEDALIRRIAGLVHVSDIERGAARLRVKNRIRPGS